MGYRPTELPDDLRMECVGICRGYDRRRRALARRLALVREGGPAAQRHAGHPEIQKVRAVQAALERFAPSGGALLLSITDRVPYERLDVPMSRAMFYHSRREFLETVARQMGYWEPDKRR